MLYKNSLLIKVNYIKDRFTWELGIPIGPKIKVSSIQYYEEELQNDLSISLDDFKLCKYDVYKKGAKLKYIIKCFIEYIIQEIDTLLIKIRCDNRSNYYYILFVCSEPSD